MNPSSILKCALALLIWFAFSAGVCQAPGPLTAGDIVEQIKSHLSCEWAEETVDTFKSGGPEVPVTGIATTFMATMDVLRQAKAAGLNLIITHEPTYYNHLDDLEPLANDPVQAAKKAYIEENGLVVFRFHDHWHRTRPDGIDKGMAEVLGWESYRTAEHYRIFELPEQTVAAHARDIQERMQGQSLRVVGRLDMPVKRIAAVLGAYPSSAHYEMLQREDVDLLLVGEAREWETVEYVRDAVALGHAKALIIMGHQPSEEGGMAYCAEWLQSFIPEVPIRHINAGEPFVDWR